MSREISFPPSLNSARDAGDPNETEAQRHRRDRGNADRERSAEQKKKAEARLLALDAAMNSLPLKVGVAFQVRRLAGLFEQTYHAIKLKLKGDTATTCRMELELKKFAKGLDKIVDHIGSMHPDTLFSWARAGETADAVYNVAALELILIEAGGWARLSLDALKSARRVGGAGRKADAEAAAMRETAAFVYERLTSRKANIAFDAYAGQEVETEFVIFLGRIYEVYGINASPKSRARKRR
jgi:hypothetical protein